MITALMSTAARSCSGLGLALQKLGKMREAFMTSNKGVGFRTSEQLQVRWLSR